jgi:hypothetical protein
MTKEKYLKVLEGIEKFRDELKTLIIAKEKYEKDVLIKKVEASENKEVQLTNNLIFAKSLIKTINTEKFVKKALNIFLTHNKKDEYENIVKEKSRYVTNRTNLIKSLKEKFKDSESINVNKIIKTVEDDIQEFKDTYKIIDLSKK